MKKILIGSDHAGFTLKEKLKAYLKKKLGYAVEDGGTYSNESCDYPDYVWEVAQAVAQKRVEQGILICKSGIGSSILANRFPGVRAALCYNLKGAKLSRQHNDSNILVLGAGFVSDSLAKKILKVWLTTSFEAGRHRRRLNKIRRMEKKIRSQLWNT